MENQTKIAQDFHKLNTLNQNKINGNNFHDKIQGDRKLRGKILKDSKGNKNKHFFS